MGLSAIIRNKADLSYFVNCISEMDILISSIEKNGVNREIIELCSNIFFTACDEGDSKLLVELDTLHKQTPLNGLVCIAENFIQLSSILSKRFSLLGNEILTSIQTTNKYEMRKSLQNKDIEIPTFYKVNSKKEALYRCKQIGFPCIIKPIQQYFSRGVLKIDNEEQLDRHYEWTLNISKRNYKEDVILVEEFIAGKEYSAEIIVERGDIIYCSYTEKKIIDSNFRDEVSHIHPYLFTEYMNKRISILMKKTIEAVGIKYGGCHIEFKIHKRRIYIIEIASRLGGGSIPQLVKLSLNIDLYNMLVKTYLGEKISLPQSTRQQFAGIKFITAENNSIIESKGLPQNVYSIPGMLNASLLFNGKREILINDSACERVGYVVCRNRDKKKLVANLNKAAQIITDSINVK